MRARSRCLAGKIALAGPTAHGARSGRTRWRSAVLADGNAEGVPKLPSLLALDTRVGTLELRIPKSCQDNDCSSLLEPRRRAERALGAVVQGADVQVVSTRKVHELAVHDLAVHDLAPALDLIERFQNRLEC